MRWSINRIYGYAPQRILIAGVLLALLLIGIPADAQQCVKFHQKFCISYQNQGYTPLPQSRSFRMEKGAFRQQKISFNNGQDYHINFAVDDLFAQKLFVQIIDYDNGKILYDNTRDHMSLNMEFSAVREINAIIHIETPASAVKKEQYNPKGCVGLLIETRPTPATGFSE